MILIVTGARHFDNQDLFDEEMKYIRSVELLIHGGAKGADTLAEKWAKKHNVKTKIFQPNWELYGISAGPRRNATMAKFASEKSKETLCLAFWDGISKGTLSCINECNKKHIICYVVNI